MPDETNGSETLNPEDSDQSVEKKILQAVKSLRYGSVDITVHDSKIVQIERRERYRFDKRP